MPSKVRDPHSGAVIFVPTDNEMEITALKERLSKSEKETVELKKRMSKLENDKKEDVPDEEPESAKESKNTKKKA